MRQPFLLLSFLAAVLVPVSFASAETPLPEIRTTIETPAQIIEALLIPPATPATRARAVHRAITVVNATKSETEVRIDTKPEDYVPGTLYTIFSRSKSGRVSASPLRVLSDTEPAPQEFPATCQGEGKDLKKLEVLPEASLRKLIEIRSRKKALLIERIRASLSPEVIERVNAAETEQGLSSGAPFSRALADDELIQRMLILASVLPEKK